MKHIHQLAHHIFTLWQTELISYCNAHRRSNLRHDLRVFIRQKALHQLNIRVNADGAGRTHHAALSAVNAVRLGDFLIKSRCYQRLGAPVCKVDGVHRLHVVAHADAVTAEDALVRISNDGRRTEIQRVLFLGIFKADVPHSHAVRQRLQLALAALDAGGAVSAMRCQQKLQDELPILHQSRRIGVDDHSVSRRLGAGGEGLSSLIFHRAQTTGAVHGQLRMIAKCWYIDICFANDGEHIRLIGKLYRPPINCHISHNRPSYFSI